ncbi:MAG: serine/threonine protein kinase [Polyangiaceae bacterium]|nr:serine/threonine protein kinase [Polyangiaceae bacterium]
MTKKTLHKQDLCGPFRIVRFAYRGRTTETFEALHDADGYEAAVTILTEEAGEDERETWRFQAETELFGELDHLNILRLRGSGEREDLPWRAMEVAAAGSLRLRLHPGRGPLKSAVALCFLRQIADAIEVLHAAGLVHGEIAPECFLLSDIDEVKLASLGGAPLVRRGEPKRAGPPRFEARRYGAPELLRGGAPNELTDVYSVGAIMREMLEGPFATQAPRWMPQFLRGIIEKAMNWHPAARYSSMAALSQALNEAWSELLCTVRRNDEMAETMTSLSTVFHQELARGEGGDVAAEMDQLETLLNDLAQAVNSSEDG